MCITKNKKDAMLKRDNFKCLRCGSKENLTIDHVIPQSMGGNDSLTNIQTLCFKCNQRKAAKIKQYSSYKSTKKYIKEYKGLLPIGSDKVVCNYCGKILYKRQLLHHQRYSVKCFNVEI